MVARAGTPRNGGATARQARRAFATAGLAHVPPAPAVRASPEMGISNLVVHVTHEYTGRGPTRARTHLHEDLVTVVLEDGLSRGERSLVREGRTDAVLEMRLAYQQTMRADFVAGIEAILDRRVAAFLSANHLDPDVAIESFVLRPRGT